MALEDVYKSYREIADTINWKQYDINELFRCCVANEEDPALKEKFYSGIMCRVWGYIGRLYIQCNKHVPIDQCYDILINAINYILKNHVWDNPNSSLYNDPKGPEKTFKVVLKRERGIRLANLNAGKRRSNFNTLSIDEARDDYNDSTDGLLLDINELTSEEDKSREIILLVKEYFDKGQYLEGFFIDAISFGAYSNFSYRRIISILCNLELNDYSYYKLVYNLDRKIYNKVLYELRTTSRRMLEIKFKQLLHSLKEEI